MSQQYNTFEIEIGDRFKLMITGVARQFTGTVIGWDTHRNAPIVAVDAEEGHTDWPPLKGGDYVLQEKILSAQAEQA